MERMANESFRIGQLPETFRIGLIKLIPKKGNSEKIEDWRPITLLSCGYKIISGVVAGRLEKYLKKITGRAQKGFLRHKNINTVTLNILNNISKAWEVGEELGVLCVDFNKAFDSIEHACISSVLKFFNFGEKMVGMVSTILRDRTARVKVEEGLSDSFNIERSTPQGDRASPYIFILCIEILLIKLVHLGGRGIEMCRFMQDMANITGLEPGVAEAYADDLTVMFKLSVENVNAIMKVLTDFEAVSGLSINKRKTQLMACGGDTWGIGTDISGITIVEKVNILGIEIDRKLETLENNWTKCISKVTRLCNYWRIFGLSITGRIMIVKTFLMAQFIYLLNCIPLPLETGNRINEMIVNFVRGNDRAIARARWFVQPELGGYGLIDINTMGISIKASWIPRWIREEDWQDYPSYLCTGRNVRNIEQIKSTDFNNHGAIKTVVDCWGKFLREFYKWNGNILGAQIFENGLLCNGLVLGGVNNTFMQLRWNEIRGEMINVKLQDFLNDNWLMVEKQELEGRLGIEVSQAEYFRLRQGVREISMEYAAEVGRVQDVVTYAQGIKKGCGKLRKYLDGVKSRKYQSTKVRELPAAQTLWGLFMEEGGGEDEEKLIRLNFKLWQINRLNSGFKNFLFKLCQGRLYLNNALFNIDGRDPGCTFCTIKWERERDQLIGNGIQNMQQNIPAESVDHIFLECRWVRQITTNLCVNKLGMGIFDEGKYMMGELWTNSQEGVTVKCLCVHFIKYQIYLMRQKKILPSIQKIDYELTVFMQELARNRIWAPFVRRING